MLLGCLLLATLYVRAEVAALRRRNPTSTALIELRIRQARKARIPYPTRMIWKNTDEISPHLVHAVLLAEDDRFYQHHGFDLEQIWIAVKTNLHERRYAYGGSTISQQLARTLYLSPRKNLLRKLLEAFFTLQMELMLSKGRILELYLNVAEWGKGIYGAEAAARHYFNTSAADLTPDEAVALASILPSPRRWNPVSEQGFMARRRTQLLHRMQRAGYVQDDPDVAASGTFDPAIPSPETISNPDSLQGSFLHEAPEHP